MSEIKGQLLGIILTLTLFTAVAAALTPVFKKYTQRINQEATTNTDITDDELETSPVVRNLMSY